MKDIITITVTDQSSFLTSNHIKPVLLSRVGIIDDNWNLVCWQHACQLREPTTFDVGERLKYRKEIPGDYRAALYRKGGYGSALYLHRDIVGLYEPSVEKTKLDEITLTYESEHYPITFIKTFELFKEEKAALNPNRYASWMQIGNNAKEGDVIALSKSYRQLRKTAAQISELQSRMRAYTPDDFIRDYPELFK